MIVILTILCLIFCGCIIMVIWSLIFYHLIMVTICGYYLAVCYGMRVEGKECRLRSSPIQFCYRERVGFLLFESLTSWWSLSILLFFRYKCMKRVSFYGFYLLLKSLHCFIIIMVLMWSSYDCYFNDLMFNLLWLYNDHNMVINFGPPIVVTICVYYLVVFSGMRVEDRERRLRSTPI